MKHFNRKSLVCLLLVLLLAATALTGCTNNETPNQTQSQTEASATQEAQSQSSETGSLKDHKETASQAKEREELGEGEKVFYLDVTGADGTSSYYTIHTQAETVGKALLELELIQGEEAGYGLYVTTVSGETLDWDKDGMYWAFYVNGEYASTGVDATQIEAEATYALVAEKG